MGNAMKMPCSAHFSYREGCLQCKARNGEISAREAMGPAGIGLDDDDDDVLATAVEAAVLAEVIENDIDGPGEATMEPVFEGGESGGAGATDTLTE